MIGTQIAIQGKATMARMKLAMAITTPVKFVRNTVEDLKAKQAYEIEKA